MSKKKLTEDFKEAFVSLLREIPNKTQVSKIMGISPSGVLIEQKKDPLFDTKIKEAMEIGYDTLEAEALRRAVDGVIEPVYYKGEVVGKVKKYSDKLLEFLLKAYRPKKFNPGIKFENEKGEKISMTFNIGSDGDEE